MPVGLPAAGPCQCHWSWWVYLPLPRSLVGLPAAAKVTAIVHVTVAGNVTNGSTCRCYCRCRCHCHCHCHCHCYWVTNHVLAQHTAVHNTQHTRRTHRGRCACATGERGR